MKEILITSSALILAVLVIRRVFRGVLSRRVQYGIWALVLARLLLPMNLPAEFSLLTATRPVQQAVANRVNQPLYSLPQGQLSQEELSRRDYPLEYIPTAQDGFVLGESEGAEPTTWLVRDPETNTVTRYAHMTVGPWEVLNKVWKAGMALMGGFFLLSNLWFYFRLRRCRREWASEARPYGVERKVYLVPEGVIPSPCLFGRSIYITPAVAEDENRLRHVLAHESTHAKHLDPLWSLLRCVCLTVYWFDPLVWVAAACSKTDCELACDEGVLRVLGETERIPYGQTLLSLIPVKRVSNPMIAATTMTSGKKQLKDRVKRIAGQPRQLMAAALAVVALAGAVSACTFTGAAPEPASDPVESQELRALTGEELRWFNEEFFNRNPNPAISYTYSIRNQFANPINLYDKPEDIDLYELFYCDGDVYDDPENDLCPSYKITEAQINAILTQHTGLTLEQTNKVNFTYEYNDALGAYTWSHGDTNYPGDIEIICGTREGSTVRLYHHGWSSGSTWYCTTLEAQSDGGYWFKSNQESEKPIIPTPLPAWEAVAAIPLAELEPYIAPTVITEPHHDDLLTRIDGYLLGNDQTLQVYSSRDGHIYAAIEQGEISYTVFLDLTDCDFSIGTFHDLFGQDGFTVSYSNMGHGGEQGHPTWVDYYTVNSDGIPALLLRSDDGWGAERVLDVNGDGVDELTTRSFLFFTHNGVIYRADLESLLLSACPELAGCDGLFWDPYTKSCAVYGYTKNERAFWRYLYFDGEKLLVYRDEKPTADHMVNGADAEVPKAVVTAARDYAQKVYEASQTPTAPEPAGESYAWGDPAVWDDWRITSFTQASRNTLGELTIEGWRFNYELHTTTPENVMLAGGKYITEDDWVSPGYPDCDWLFFRVENGAYTFLWYDMINDMGPQSYLFQPYLEEQLESLGLTDAMDYYAVQTLYEEICSGSRITVSHVPGGGLTSRTYTVSPTFGNSVSSITDKYSGFRWTLAEAPVTPDAQVPAFLVITGEDTAKSLIFYDWDGMVEYRDNGVYRWYRAEQTLTDDPFVTDIYHYVRRWFNEMELDGLRQDIAIPGNGRSREAIAQAWVEAYEGAYLNTTPGSHLRWSFMKVIDMELDLELAARKGMDENTVPFSYSTIFVPESTDGINWFMAGNTAEYEGTDPAIPDGAFQWWHCGYLHLGEDGLWRCNGTGTGW